MLPGFCNRNDMSKLILIVDDSPTVIMSLKSNLTLNGYQVESAADGLAALSRLKAGLRPALIITDFNMPLMNGGDLVREVKAIASLKFTPILMLTTESDPKKREEGRKMGITGWLVKPITGADLLKVIAQVLPAR